jgi:hypothetical protein
LPSGEIVGTLSCFNWPDSYPGGIYPFYAATLDCAWPGIKEAAGGPGKDRYRDDNTEPDVNAVNKVHSDLAEASRTGPGSLLLDKSVQDFADLLIVIAAQASGDKAHHSLAIDDGGCRN